MHRRGLCLAPFERARRRRTAATSPGRARDSAFMIPAAVRQWTHPRRRIAGGGLADAVPVDADAHQSHGTDAFSRGSAQSYRVPPPARRSRRSLHRSHGSHSVLAPINGTGGLPYAGRINSIALDPTNLLTLYVGTATGGVWKINNGGTSWSPAGRTPSVGSRCGSAVDPVNPQIVLVGTGEAELQPRQR